MTIHADLTANIARINGLAVIHSIEFKLPYPDQDMIRLSKPYRDLYLVMLDFAVEFLNEKIQNKLKSSEISYLKERISDLSWSYDSRQGGA